MKSKKANDELYSKGLRPMLGSDTQTFLSLILLFNINVNLQELKHHMIFTAIVTFYDFIFRVIKVLLKEFKDLGL